ncbi:sulfatase-like hydrolase/transferase [bacterium]|nr:sulfatase-like hydrolase/transferase [bacterium]
MEYQVKDSKSNILVIITDQQQGKTVFLDSVCKMPAIKELISEGILFNRAYTPNAICSPTRASILTALFPHTHGMYDCTHTVDRHRAEYEATLPTWIQILREEGYQTAYLGKWHVERSGRLELFGFDYYEEPEEIDTLRRSYQNYRQKLGFPPFYNIIYGKRIGGNGYREQLLYGITDEPVEASRPYFIFSKAIEYIEKKLSSDKPWCLFVSTPEPHDPYIAHQEFYELYNPSDITPPINFEDNLLNKPNVLKRMQKVWEDLEWKDFAEAIRCYYASCSLIDSQVGRLIGVLKKKGYFDNTIVMYLSDHGDMMGGHRLLTKGITPYEEVYRVPLIIRIPGFSADKNICSHIVNIGSIGPTILELTGCRALPKIHFPSLSPLIRDLDSSNWEDFTFAEFHGQRYFFTQRIVWNGPFKFIFNGFDYDELYNLEEDPGEMHNLSDEPEYYGIKKSMIKKMWKVIRETEDKTLAEAHYWTLRFLDFGPDIVNE